MSQQEIRDLLIGLNHITTKFMDPGHYSQRGEKILNELIRLGGRGKTHHSLRNFKNQLH